MVMLWCAVWNGGVNVVICVVNVVLVVEFVVICGCGDCVVHGEICGILDACGREQGCSGVDVLLSWM